MAKKIAKSSKSAKSVAKQAKPASVKRGKATKAKKAAVNYSPAIAESRGVGLQFDDATALKVIERNNPKRGASAPRYAKAYLGKKTPRTVGEAIANGALRADIRWDAAHGFIKLGR